MARGKYEYWLTEEGLALLAAWARDGATDEDIAERCDINPCTLYDWKKKHPKISEALKKGKEVVDAQVENALLDSALAGEAWAVCFWLKNRRPDKWRDKPTEDTATAHEKLDRILEGITHAARRP